MKYMLLIYSEFTEPEGTPEEQEANMKRWGDYTEDLQKSGAFVAGDALQPPATATTVRVRNEQRAVTDGPFAETKEVLGGYYLIDVETLDEALDWAEQCPAADYGSIEVRPLVEFPQE